MKSRPIVLFAALLAGTLSVLCLASRAGAQVNYQWDPGQTMTGSDGSGNWDSGTNWAYSGSNVAWQDGSNAVIGYGTGAAGTITIGNIVAPDSITFNPAGSGNYVITGGSINLANANTSITFNTSATISSQLVGSGGLSMAGSGTLVLTTTATYTGGTQINGGILNINGDAALGAASGPLTFTGNGTLQAGIDGIALNASRTLTLNSGVTATIDTQAFNMSIAGSIGGQGSLTKTGSGTLTLAGNSSYNGRTVINQGTLLMQSGIVDASLPSNFAANGTVVNGYQDFFKGTALNSGWTTNQPGLFSVSGGALHVNGTGIDPSHLLYEPAGLNPSGTWDVLALVELPHSNSIILGNNGARAGVCAAGNVGSGAAGQAYDELFYGGNGTNVELLDDFASWGPNVGPAWSTGTKYWMDLSVTSGNSVSAKFWPANGVTTEASAATTTWSYNTLSGFAGITGPSGALTSMDVYYVLIRNSQLPSIVAGSEAGAVPSTTTMAIASGATWDINGTAQTVAGLTDVNAGSGGILVNSSTGASVLTLSPTGGTNTFSGMIAGGGTLGAISLVMSGSGTQVLAGSNTYSGGTQIVAGILNINGDAALGAASGPLTFTGNGTLQAGVDGIVLNSSRNLTLNNGVTATIDTQAFNMTIAGSIGGQGSLAKAGAGTLTISNTNTFGGVDSAGNPYGIVSIHQGAIQVSPGGVLTNNTSEIDVGDTAGQTGTLTMSSGTAIVPFGSTGYSGVNVGIHGGTGILTLTGNSLLDATATNQNTNPPGQYAYVYWYNVVDIGLLQGSAGTVVVGGTSTLRANNGPYNNTGYICVGDGGTGTLTIQDQGLAQTGNFFLGSTFQSGQAGGTGTLRLNGGTLSVPTVQNAVGTTGNLYFNGGTLQATANSGLISASGTLNAYVQAGGAVIDSNGYNTTFNQPLLHDPSGPPLDGGLTKQGTGILTLTTPQSYSGPTIIASGTLALQPIVPQLPNITGAGISLQRWYDAANLNGNGSKPSNGSTVSTWHDLSGHGYNATNTGGGATGGQGTPVYYASGPNTINGHPAVWFGDSGGNDLGFSMAGINSGNSPSTVFVVGQLTGYSNNWGWRVAYGAASNGGARGIGQNPGNQLDFTTFGADVAGPALNNNPPTPVVAEATFGPGNSLVGTYNYSGLTSTVSANPTLTTGTNGGHIGGRVDGGIEYWPGSVGEVLIYNGALSVAQQQAVEAYLAYEWRKTNPSLPSGTAVQVAAGAALDLGGWSQQVASLSDFAPGSGGNVINSAVATTSVLTLSPTGGTTTFSGTILGGGTLGTISLVMSGSGTQVLAGSLLGPGSLAVNAGNLVLSGNDSYTGGTTVNAGTLIATSSTALPDGTSLTVGAGGTFIFDPTQAGAPAIASPISPVPEPATPALLGVGAIGLLAFAWRRRDARSR